jgi:hypothetical protein
MTASSDLREYSRTQTETLKKYGRKCDCMSYLQKNLDPELLYYFCPENNDVITKPKNPAANTKLQGKITEDLKASWIEEYERTGQSPTGVIVYKNNEVSSYKFDVIDKSVLKRDEDGDLITAPKTASNIIHRSGVIIDPYEITSDRKRIGKTIHV